MNAEIERAAKAAAPGVVHQLQLAGLSPTIVSMSPVWVRSRAHEVPVPLHDLDDARWFIAEAARA